MRIFFYPPPPKKKKKKNSKIGKKLDPFFLKGFTVIFDQKNKKSRNQ